MDFSVNEMAILNGNALSGLPMRVGERVKVLFPIRSVNFDYEVEFDDKTTSKVKVSELNRLTEDDVKFMEYITQGNKVEYTPIRETVEIVKVDYLHKTAEIRHYQDGEEQVVLFESLDQ
jgi:hypothetical protein